MKTALLFCCCMLFLHPASAQSDLSTQAFGAKSQGMGNGKLFHQDAWSLFNNIGALDRATNSQIASSMDQRFALPELSTVALSGLIKGDAGSLGLGIARYGAALFNQHLIGVGISATRGIMSFGGKIEWMQTQIEGFGTGNAFFFSFGGIAELGPKFFLGSHFSNLNQAKLSKNSSQQLPTLMQLGLSYLPSKNLVFHAELEKDLEAAPILKIGLQYQLEDWIYLRTGIHSHPSRLSFGLGLRKKWIGLDYAYGQNAALGSSHHLSLHLNR
jgi:hypothetical protein